jgi:hypothetical protein
MFQLLLISNVIYYYGLPDRGTCLQLTNYTSALDQPVLRNFPGFGKIHHELVSLQITNGVERKWITFEKGRQGIFSQVSRDRNKSLKDKKGSVRRVLEEKESKRFDGLTTRVSLKDFFQFYVETSTKHPRYKLLFSNCQNFAQDLSSYVDELFKIKGKTYR